jgi:hypothetical protein
MGCPEVCVIISASRRTDLPAFYSGWLRARLEAGHCRVANPFNRKQVSRVSLLPGDVDAIVFWTRHARPMFELLPLLERRGYRWYVQYTINGYGPPVEARVPTIDVATRTVRELAEHLPPGGVVWRYDPILLGPAFPAEEHRARFARIAAALEGSVRRVVISIVDLYRKTRRRMAALYAWDSQLASKPDEHPGLPELLSDLVGIAGRHGMTVQACAEAEDLTALGIERTKCIDDGLLSELYGGVWTARKDLGQRPLCRCIPSRDIGRSDTCTFGCAYCYATSSDAAAQQRRRSHDPNAESLG